MRHLATLCSLLSLAGAAWAATPPAPEPPAPDSNPHRGGAVDRDGNRISDGLQGTLERARPGDTLRVVVTFQGPGSAESARRAVGPFELHREFRIINGFAATMTAAQVRALAQHPGVFRIEEDLPVSVKLDAARADFGADAARTAFGVSGAGVKACIVDTGIDPNHEQLNERLAGFYDAINGRTDAYDDHGHGTHVASIAFGDGNGGSSAARWRGVAPAVSVYGAKVLDASGSGSESSVIAGIEWCVDRGVHIVSMSLGTSAASDGKDALSQAANAAAANAAVIVAAGNSGDQDRTVGSPGAAELAVTVGACAEHSAPAGSSNHSDGVYLTAFSSRGPTLDGRTKPDLCAPGHSITAARSGSVNGYVAYSGTSMATPFVAGVVALGLEAQAMSPATVKQRLEATAQDRGPAGKDNDHGAGLLDAHAFVAQAKGVTTYTPTAYPTSQRVLGQVATHGLWRHTFSLATADLGIPIGAALTIDGQPKCTTSYFGICFAMQWDPDLDARLIDPNGTLLADSNCLADDECGLIGRQETLHAMPTVAGTYTIEVFPAEDSGNNGKGGSFALDLSTGPMGGGSGGGGGGGGGGGDGGSTPTAHLYDMSGTPVANKSNWQASVTITLHGSDHTLLQLPATVSGNWSDGYTGSGSCQATTGQCTVTSGNIPKRKTSATFTVTNVSGNLTYQASANHVPNSITVNKP